MKKNTLPLVCALFVHIHHLEAQEIKSRYQIHSDGRTEELVLASDEVAVTEADGRHSVIKASLMGSQDVAAAVKAERKKRGAGTKVELVAYEQGALHDVRKQRIITQRILVQMQDTTLAAAVAKSSGTRLVKTPVYAPGHVILEAGNSEAALVAMELLRQSAGVLRADVLLARQRARKLIPNDPLFSQQWHHRNTTQSGGALWVDANITTAWDIATGSGITIGILDDGVEHTHPDLQPNYNTAIDYDFNSADNDPTPVDLAADSHGTACAGVAAASGGNSLGVSGAAPAATLTGFRLIAAPSTDQDEADAFLLNNHVIQVKSNSWGLPDGSGYGGPGTLATAALATAATTGRGGLGTVMVFAGGNGFDLADNSNYDGYSNSPYVIAVAALNDFGFQSYYSEKGANLVVSAPSNGGGHNQGIVTTDLTGENGDNNAAQGADDLSDRNYTKHFGGTSSACPLVSGVCALMLQANPNLGWRDVKEILIRSARKIHRTDPDWSVNGAGISFNHKYGAGMVDAAAAVSLAQQWTNLGAMTTTQLSQTAIAAAIPDNNATGVTRTFNFSSANFRVEHVTVSVNATHTAVGDLEVVLTSPGGMTSQLAQQFNDGTNDLDWTYSSVRHWGENASGNWTVKIADRVNADTGTLNSVTVKLWGSTVTTARIAGTTGTLTSESNIPANSAADPGETVTFTLGLKNINGPTTSALTATLLPLCGVTEPGTAQNYGALVAGGTAVERTFSFKAHGGCGMVVSALLKLQDGATDLGYAAVSIPLGTSATNAFSGGAISIPTSGTGSPYPSTRSVTGLSGRVQNLTALVSGFTHAYPDDAGLLLAGPDDLKIRLFCGGTDTALSSRNLTFDDAGAVLFPFDGPVPSSTYRPWDWYGPYDATENPGGRDFTSEPNFETAYSMGEFRGVPANGNWRLYAQDFSAGDGGSLTGWTLTFTTVDCLDNTFLAAANTNTPEGAGSVLVSVTRTGGREGTSTVNYATSNGTATAGSDYTTTSGTLTFNPGETTKSFPIAIANDGSIESDETVNLTLYAATGNSTLGTLATGTVTIQDDDTPTPVTLSPSPTSVVEAASSITFTVSRTSTNSSGSVSYSTTAGSATAGSDFTATSGTLNFGTGEVSKTFTVDVLNDVTLEQAETFTVVLSSPAGAISLGSPSDSVVTITDGDADSDGMPDDYESGVGLNASLNDAALDLDGDGLSNISEYITGSLPNSGTSIFMPAVTTSGSNVDISFPSLTGRTYIVEWSQSLVNPWNILQQNIPGTGSTITITDSGAVSQTRRFYHVIVTMP